MTVEIKKEYRFEAAHHLPRVPENHKCRRIHGHSYRVELCAQGPIDPETGWLVDFYEMDVAWSELFARFDHRILNDVPGLENSTCENLAVYVWTYMKEKIPALSAVTVWETADAGCTFRGP